MLSVYERWARRLLPALFAVIIVSLPFAWFLLLPSEMVDLVKSQLASIFFVSNMYWWNNALTYGGRSSLVQPFLHTWSVVVEEQFYIVFPVFYLTLLRFAGSHRQVLNALVATAILGLIFAEVMTRQNWDLSFYFFTSRVLELLAGAALAHLLIRFPNAGHRRWLLYCAPLLGLAMVLMPMWTMTLDWHRPGFGTLSAVLGKVLIIWFASPSDPVTRLSSTRAFVSVGLISYSLYLWHYPIFAFGRMIEEDPGLPSKTTWFYLSFLFAILSYRYIEKPFLNRAAIPLPKLLISTAGSTLIITSFALAMLASDGLRSNVRTRPCNTQWTSKILTRCIAEHARFVCQNTHEHESSGRFV